MKALKWKVQFEVEVDREWVEDGFDMTHERLFASLRSDWLLINGVKNVVIKSPSPKLIRSLQYEDQK
jgi:hypothetical protein